MKGKKKKKLYKSLLQRSFASKNKNMFYYKINNIKVSNEIGNMRYHKSYSNSLFLNLNQNQYFSFIFTGKFFKKKFYEYFSKILFL